MLGLSVDFLGVGEGEGKNGEGKEFQYSQML